MKYDIVIVDTGYNGSHPRLKNRSITGIQICKKDVSGYEIITLPKDNDDVGHGTAVSNIIYTHAPDASILMVKIFDKLLYVDEDLLYFTLNYILSRVDCKLINLSLGIPALKDYKKMYNVCDKINKKGIVIVAAFDNDGSVSFPAAFDNVVGVTSNNYCYKNDEYFVIDNSIVNVGAKGNMQKIAWLDNKYSIGQGNSYACAHISGISIKQLNEMSSCNCQKLLKKLKAHQSSEKESHSYKYDNSLVPKRHMHYKNAAIFPFNKEMHSLVRFQSLLPFRIVDVYDIKYSPNIGASTDLLLNIATKNPYTIKKIDDIDWEAIDTLIIGHTHTLLNSVIKDCKLMESLLYSAQEQNKNVFSFDNLPSQFKKNEKFLCPDLHDNYIPIPYGKLYRQTKPVLAVFGTSSKQGKFTLQLLLREKLIKKGYLVGQLGTEPSSLLFGMDECFHFGYDSEMQLSRFSAIAFLNNALYTISQKNVDLIITGCQSESILTGEGNLFNYPIPQIEFLLGVLPDAIVLVINPFDELQTIKRTISFLESCVECKVIAVVMFPMTHNIENPFGPKVHIFNSEFEQLSTIINQVCKVPVFLLDNNLHMDSLISLIEEYFSN